MAKAKSKPQASSEASPEVATNVEAPKTITVLCIYAHSDNGSKGPHSVVFRPVAGLPVVGQFNLVYEADPGFKVGEQYEISLS